MWELNVKLLTPASIEGPERDYTAWRTVKILFVSHRSAGDSVKGNIKRFFVPKGVEKARERMAKLSKPRKTMQNPILLQMIGVNVMADLQEVKSQQSSLFASEASKFMFWSRVRTVEQDETCSSFFFQKVHKESSVFSNLKEENDS
eukprot:g18349.t1